MPTVIPHRLPMSIFVWGLGKNGQLGQGNRDNCLIPVKLLLDDEKGVKSPSKKSINHFNLSAV